jgi:choice-of-anchor C domain-containing protein
MSPSGSAARRDGTDYCTKGSNVKSTSKVRIGLTLLALCVFALGRPAAAQNLIQNGSFEIGTDPGGFSVVYEGSGQIASWNVTNGSVDYIGTFWQAQDGSRSIDMSGSSAGTMASQTFVTEIGQNYLVSFWMAGNPDGPPPIKSMDVLFDGVARNFEFDNTGKTRQNMGWEKHTFVATATGTTSTLTFRSLTNGVYGPALDNVSVVAVTPEAGGIVNMCAALMGPGLGLLAVRRRARRAKASTSGTE